MKRIIISMPNFIGDSINTISVIDFTKNEHEWNVGDMFFTKWIFTG
ncbi:hypothetical protein GGR14_000917 [Butyricimonas faecihominis]|uniref:Uncharacterized protein n=1 Tax=Butyricimonas faecihominis TaxID=1472416 RepID=A0A7W6MXU1_9BACT|nr:hypothetical protein [Butyricimonas faecihominis]